MQVAHERQVMKADRANREQAIVMAAALRKRGIAEDDEQLTEAADVLTDTIKRIDDMCDAFDALTAGLVAVVLGGDQ